MLILLPFIILFLAIPLAQIFSINYAKSLPQKFYQSIYKNREQFYLPIIINLESYKLGCEMDPQYAQTLLNQYLRNNLKITFTITCNELLNNFNEVKARIISTLVNKDYSVFLSVYNQGVNILDKATSSFRYLILLAIGLIIIYVYKNKEEEERIKLVFLVPSIVSAIGLALIISSKLYFPIIKSILGTALSLFNGFFPLYIVNNDANTYFFIGLFLFFVGIVINALLYYYFKYVQYII